MEFVVLLSVFAITLTQVIAIPTNSKDHLKMRDGNSEEVDSSEALKMEQFQFKFPQTLKQNISIIYNGTLRSSDKKFTVVLPNTKSYKNQHCTLNYNHTTTTIEVSPSVMNYDKSRQFEIYYDEVEEPNFTLNITVKVISGVNMIEMSLAVEESGNIIPMHCMIESFEDLGYIYFKEGVKQISSILFTFSNNTLPI